MKLHERLKEARTRKNLTQQEVADVLHISRTTVSSWEVGRTIPSLDFIIDLSNLYDLSLDVLLKEDMTMVNQVSKEIKNGKKYKWLVVAICSVLSLFILVNCIWFIRIKNQYSYLDNHWTKVEDSYVYSKNDVNLMTPQMDIKMSVSQNYLKKPSIWIMGTKKGKDNTIGLTFRADEKVFASVPIESKSVIMTEVRVDKDINLINDEENTKFLNENNELSWGETKKGIDDYLKVNQQEFKELYVIMSKEYELIND